MGEPAEILETAKGEILLFGLRKNELTEKRADSVFTNQSSAGYRNWRRRIGDELERQRCEWRSTVRALFNLS